MNFNRTFNCTLTENTRNGVSMGSIDDIITLTKYQTSHKLDYFYTEHNLLARFTGWWKLSFSLLLNTLWFKHNCLTNYIHRRVHCKWTTKREKSTIHRRSFSWCSCIACWFIILRDFWSFPFPHLILVSCLLIWLGAGFRVDINKRDQLTTFWSRYSVLSGNRK